MKLEQLYILKEMFYELQEMKKKNIQKNVVEDLKEEIKKRETELESISIVKLNKLV